MEVLDVYNEKGEVLNKTTLRGCKDDDLLPGEHFAVSIIFIENSKGEFLIQRIPKGTYTATGGHIHSGESPRQAVIRETMEEIGIDISNDDFKELGFRLLDFPLRFLYYLKKDIDIKDMKLDPVEVDSVYYMSISEIYNLIKENKMKKGHALLFREIMKYKTGKNNLNDVFMKYKDKYNVKYPNDNVNYFVLKFKSNKNDYKLEIGDNEFYLFKKKKVFNHEYYDEINDYKFIDTYEELCNKIDECISKYERE